MDIGVWMRAEVFEEKLRAQEQANSEQVWNLSRWPKGLSEDGENRLFVAVRGAWRGYFILSREAMINSADSTAYSLLFDTRTWTPFPPFPMKCFRGFTYKVPQLPSPASDLSLEGL